MYSCIHTEHSTLVTVLPTMLLQMKMLRTMVVLSVLANAHCKCPCSNPDWCKPIKAPDRKEVFIFAAPITIIPWNRFDWTRITTVGVLGDFESDPQYMCLAHQHNARVVSFAQFTGGDLQNATIRSAWVKSKVNTVKSNYMDGINIEFEDSIAENDHKQIQALTELVNETYMAFKKDMPHSQVTMNVPYGPNCINKRCYDFKSLGLVVDFFFIMDYDEWSGSVAGPNSGFQYTKEGLKKYLEIVSPEKLLLGVPWYGYKYRCSKLTTDQRCTAGNDTAAMNFSDIYNILTQTNSTRMWDEKSLSPYFSYTDTSTKQVYQIWYDDPESLIYKYNMAAKKGLRGVGAWSASGVYYDTSPLNNAVRQWMWDALPLVQ